jgi:hypothetical protein
MSLSTGNNDSRNMIEFLFKISQLSLYLTPLTLVYTLIPTLSFKVSWLQITESDNNFYDSMYSAPSVNKINESKYR